MSAARILHRLGLLFRLFDAAKKNQQQPAPVLTAQPSMKKFNAFVSAAEAFTKAHIVSDELDVRDDGDDGPPVTSDEHYAADVHYNQTKHALVDAYKSMVQS